MNLYKHNMDTQNSSIKRKKTNTSPDLDQDTTEQAFFGNSWPRFIVIEGTDQNQPLSKLSPFAVEKALQGIAGTLTNVKRLKSGALVVEALREGQSKNLLNIEKMANVPVKATPHRSLNSSKGVIRSSELMEMDSDELLDKLRPQNVTEVRNIMQTRNGQRRKTNTIVLTFATSTIPNALKAGFLHVKVEPFIPNPLRCFNCQKYGHHKSNCNHAAVCAKCSLPAHGEDQCSAEAKCTNCTGNHPAYFTSCPMWIKEKEICRVKTENNISYPEARKLINANDSANISNTTGVSYAQAVRATIEMQSIGTQTDTFKCGNTDCKCCTIANQSTSKSVAAQTTQYQPSTSNQTSTKNQPTTSNQTSTQHQSSTSNQTIKKSNQPSTNIQNKSNNVQKPSSVGPSQAKPKSAQALSVSPRQSVGKTQDVQRGRRFTDRLPKGANNPISLSDRFESLDMEVESEPPDPGPDLT